MGWDSFYYKRNKLTGGLAPMITLCSYWEEPQRRYYISTPNVEGMKTVDRRQIGMVSVI